MLTAHLKQRGWVRGCINLILISGQRMPKTLQYRMSVEKFRVNENIHKVLSILVDDVKIVEASSDHMWGTGVPHQMTMPCLDRTGIVMDL